MHTIQYNNNHNTLITVFNTDMCFFSICLYNAPRLFIIYSEYFIFYYVIFVTNNNYSNYFYNN